jgi:probable rRNA maturation factor
MELVSIRNLTRQPLPRVPFERIAKAILGPRGEVSLAFVGPVRSRRMNLALRGKDKSANVLTFPLAKGRGEILIDLATARKHLAEFGLSERKFVALLFIHGCLHLAGRAHGARMEREERALLGRFL